MSNRYETGVDAKQRLIFKTAMKGEFGLKLCERHYFIHVEGSEECIMQTARQFYGVLEELDEECNHLDSLLDELKESLESE